MHNLSSHIDRKSSEPTGSNNLSAPTTVFSQYKEYSYGEGVILSVDQRDSNLNWLGSNGLLGRSKER